MKMMLWHYYGLAALLWRASWAFQALPRPSTRPRISRVTSTSLYVFERMSEECIAAIVTAQQQCQRLQLVEVSSDVMLAGCIDHPETRAMERTLQASKITWRATTAALKERYAAQDDQQVNRGWLAGFRAASDDDNDRPFGKDLKLALTRAGKLADAMKSTSVRVHHVFLALLDYKETNGEMKCGADETPDQFATWTLMQELPGWDSSTTALQVCETLLANLKESSASAENQGPELVTGQGRGSSSTPTLEECGVDLTQQARDGRLDVVFGRDEEIRACLRTLLRRRKNCVCLIGDPGVGKTAIAEGVAQILVDEDRCPTRLKGHRLVSLELATLVAGTKYRGEFEERLQAIVAEVTDEKSPPTILFLDEIHNLVGAGAAEGGMDAANLLKPALARGAMQLIGATTVVEYRKYIEKDAALERRLQPVMVKESTVEQTIDILKAVQSNYELHHGVTYTPEALEAAAYLSERYVTDRFLPDKALDLLDESGAIAQLEKIGDEKPVVDEHVVAAVISDMSGIPIGKLESSELDRLKTLEKQLEGRVKGQTRAVRTVARAIRRARSGLRDPKRPVASLFFAGPTGTGKTELCKTLAETYFGSEKDMIRIDMSEFQQSFTLSRLIGSPPGYVGYEEAGQLTEAVRRSPHSVVLLDEVEKAHEDVLNILLQVMEDGMLTDGKGRTINFKNAILVMTSNVGSKRILEVARGQGTQSTATAPTNGDRSRPEPISPEEALKRIQNNPKALSLLLQATSDPDMMEAIRTAMNGSPADLLKAGQSNPKVASFLEELWSIIGDGEEPKSSVNGDKRPSGLAAIRGSIQDSLEAWSASASDTFASGLLSQMGGTEQGQDHVLYPMLVQVVKEELEAKMKPELLNRIDEIVVFSPLGTCELMSIAQLMVDRTLVRAREEQGLSLEVGPQLISRIVEEGSSKADQFGARPMRRAAQRYVEDSLSDALIQGFVSKGESAKLELSSTMTANGKYLVEVNRADGKQLLVEVEDSSGGIDGVSSAKAITAPSTATSKTASQGRS